MAGEVAALPSCVWGSLVPLLLKALRLDDDGFGCITARELAARCRRRLWPEFVRAPEREALLALPCFAQRYPDGDVLYC